MTKRATLSCIQYCTCTGENSHGEKCPETVENFIMQPWQREYRIPPTQLPQGDKDSTGTRVWSTKATTLTTLTHWLQPQTGLVKSTPGRGHRTKVPFFLPTWSLRKSWVSLTPHSQDLEKFKPIKMQLTIYLKHKN